MNLKIKALWSKQSHDWQQLRIPLLAVTFIGVVSLGGKAILTSNKTSPVTPFAFPHTVPLTGWQFSQSRPLPDQTTKSPDRGNTFLGGRYYQYTQSNLPLDIEMRYVVARTGEIRHLVRRYTPISLPRVLFHQRQHQGVGFHSFFTYQGRAYLSACINPRGGTTVTHRQFVQNQFSYAMQFEHLLPVLLGQESLQDKRCLWGHLSVPLKNSSPESAHQTLEKAWVSWYQWWQPNFPKSRRSPSHESK